MTNDNERGMWVEQFNELEIWLADKGYNLEMAHDVEDCVILEDKLVCIQSRNSAETRYYSLLHECGHILVSQGSKQWEKDVPMYAQDPKVMNDARRRRGKSYKVSLIAEEIEAWKRGRKLSNRMGHYIDDKKYDNIMAVCVYTYVEMAACTP